MSLSGCIAECLCGSYLLNTRPIAALSDATSTILLCLVWPDRDPDTMMTKLRERDSGIGMPCYSWHASFIPGECSSGRSLPPEAHGS